MLAEIPHLFGAKYTAQMTYYATRAGARLFAAGAFSLASSADDPTVSPCSATCGPRCRSSVTGV